MIPQQSVRSAFDAVIAAVMVVAASNHGEKVDDDEDVWSEPDKGANVESADLRVWET